MDPSPSLLRGQIFPWGGKRLCFGDVTSLAEALAPTVNDQWTFFFI